MVESFGIAAFADTHLELAADRTFRRPGRLPQFILGSFGSFQPIDIALQRVDLGHHAIELFPVLSRNVFLVQNLLGLSVDPGPALAQLTDSIQGHLDFLSKLLSRAALKTKKPSK